MKKLFVTVNFTVKYNVNFVCSIYILFYHYFLLLFLVTHLPIVLSQLFIFRLNHKFPSVNWLHLVKHNQHHSCPNMIMLMTENFVFKTTNSPLHINLKSFKYRLHFSDLKKTHVLKVNFCMRRQNGYLLCLFDSITDHISAQCFVKRRT